MLGPCARHKTEWRGVVIRYQPAASKCRIPKETDKAYVIRWEQKQVARLNRRPDHRERNCHDGCRCAGAPCDEVVEIRSAQQASLAIATVTNRPSASSAST